MTQQEISHISIDVFHSNYIINFFVLKYNDNDQVFKVKITNLIKKHNILFLYYILISSFFFKIVFVLFIVFKLQKIHKYILIKSNSNNKYSNYQNIIQ